MNPRLAVVSACAGAALVAFVACSSDDALAPADLVGAWTGTTSQGREIDFTVTDDGVTDAEIGYLMSGRCTFSAVLPLTTIAPLSITDGRFTTGRTQIGPQVFITATGEFTSASAATGTILIQDAPCSDTLNLTWTAAKLANE